MTITRGEFSQLYQACVSEVLTRLPEDWSALARHNAGWRKGRFDAAAYLRSSEVRYWHAYGILARDRVARVLDVGGFLGAFPLALKRLGFVVAIAEKYGYYGSAMAGIASCLASSGIEVIDMDFTEHDAGIDPLTSRFDAVTCMALAEHLAHSPRQLMENIRAALRPEGTLVFEVPNVAFWPRRYAFFFRGETVYAPIGDVYHSEVPFTGHHREYTLGDARYVVEAAGFTRVSDMTFNYSIPTATLFDRLKFLPAHLFREWAEVILLHCRRAADKVS
jgi:SAM-dependent methyltransferase